MRTDMSAKHSLEYVWEFGFYVVGVFTLYQFYAVLQEYIFNSLPGFEFAWFLTLLQFISYAIISSIVLYVSPTNANDTPSTPIPWKSYTLVAVFAVTTVGASNYALQFLSYPTQVLFKCCKLLPVMFVGVIYLRKQYEPLHYFAVVLLSFGIAMFSVGNTLVNATFDPFGVFLISIALGSDAFIGNVQEKAMKDHGCTTVEMIFYSKGIGSVLLLLVTILKGELIPALAYCYALPKTVLLIFVFSSVGCVGEFFVMGLVKRFGALVAVTVTAMRKVFTILLSFLIFPKPFSLFHLLGLLLVAIGIGLNIYVKNRTLLQEWMWTYKQVERSDDSEQELTTV